MKNILKFAALLTAFLFLSNSCTKETTIPIIQTSVATTVTYSGASGTGTISSNGGAEISEKGICWGLAPGTSVAVNKIQCGFGNTPFTWTMSGLSPGTVYYVKTYAINSAGTGYGNEISFTTNAVAASLTTTAVSSITSTGAVSGGTISSDGGSAVISRGVCWSTLQNPATSGSKTTDGTGTGEFTSTISGLSPGVTYYVRAYATNNIGTTYGQEVSFRSLATPPVVTTSDISLITTTSAQSGGSVSEDGGEILNAKGVCWSTAQNPTLDDFKTVNSFIEILGNNPFSKGNFTTANAAGPTYISSLTSLSPGTTYYARAYATNSVGTTYGAQKSFTTLASAPDLTTTAISDITATTATGGGNVTNNGGAAVTSRGICWSTAQNPTVSNSKTTDGSGSGAFTSLLSGLTPGATYYVRAYAANSEGTSYGNQVTFVTGSVIPTITTAAITNITTTTATSGGNVTFDGGTTVYSRGVCWSTSQGPTVSDYKTTDGTGSGIFTSSLSGLAPGTTYYVRAYATNSDGTSYGNQVIFITGATVPSVTTAAVTSITSFAAISGGNVISTGGAAVSARGVCWSTSQNPTIYDSKTSDGIGLGEYTSSLSGLTPGATYYVRAYATNNIGTTYGANISFKTVSEIINIPDLIFKNYCLSLYDENNNKEIDLSEAYSINVISCHNFGIKTLEGIQHFKNLEFLECAQNEITSLDVSKNLLLNYLVCNSNKLTSIDVSKNDKLEQLDIGYNLLTSIDVSKNKELQSFGCNNNKISFIDVSNNNKLISLVCGFNQLTNIDISQNPYLNIFDCQSNNITSINFKNNPELTLIFCQNNKLTSLDVSNLIALKQLTCKINTLTSIKFGIHPNINVIDCSENQINVLDITQLESLGAIVCNNNKLTSLDVSKNSALTNISVDHNMISSIYIDQNPNLKYLFCGYNQIKSLNLNNATHLTHLYCGYNELTSLDISKNCELIYLNVVNNNLSTFDASYSKVLSSIWTTGNPILYELWLSKEQVFSCLYYDIHTTVKYK